MTPSKSLAKKWEQASNVEPSLRFAPFTGEGSVRRGSCDLPGNSLSNCMERASPEIYPLLVPLFAPVAMTQASLAIEQWQVSRGISFLPSGGNFMPMVNCLVGWKSLAQAALFQLDFSGCWSRISSCTGRADFSAALCVTVLPGRCRGRDGAWYGPAPQFCQRGPLAQLASRPHTAPCKCGPS